VFTVSLIAVTDIAAGEEYTVTMSPVSLFTLCVIVTESVEVAAVARVNIVSFSVVTEVGDVIPCARAASRLAIKLAIDGSDAGICGCVAIILFPFYYIY
jgi:hypothetical protein